jgi:hypothetical protein
MLIIYQDIYRGIKYFFVLVVPNCQQATLASFKRCPTSKAQKFLMTPEKRVGRKTVRSVFLFDFKYFTSRYSLMIVNSTGNDFF